MKKQRVYEITNIDEFAESIRSIILENFYSSDTKLTKEISKFDELMKTKREKIEEKLTLQEAKNIIKPILKTVINSVGEKEYTVSHKNFKKILEELNRRVISNILMELVSDGLVETGFDEEKNDFIFWVADSD
jgi:hypothetical protein